MTPERAELVEWASSLSQEDALHTPYKTYCGSRIAAYLNVPARFLHTLEDLIRAIRRHGFSVRSRVEYLRTTKTSLRGIRRRVSTARVPAGSFWLVRSVDKNDEGHVLLLDKFGNTLVDTAPNEHNAVTDVYLLRRR